MPSFDLISHSAQETTQKGGELGSHLKAPVLLLLYGDLGAGKTTFAKGIVSGLGVAREDDVTSPTFTLVHGYRNHVRVYHIDLYRVEGLHDLETLGLEDIFAEPAIVLVEWAEKLALRTDWPILRINLEHVDDDTRRISVSDLSGALNLSS